MYQKVPPKVVYYVTLLLRGGAGCVAKEINLVGTECRVGWERGV